MAFHIVPIPMNPQPPGEPVPNIDGDKVYATSSGEGDNEYSEWSQRIPSDAVGIQEIGDQWCWLVKCQFTGLFDPHADGE